MYTIDICILIYCSNTILRLNRMFKTYISVIKLYKISVVSDNLILWGWSNLRRISDDSRGQLFSLDLLFALIPLVLVLGMVASDMDNVMYLIQDTVFRGSTDRVAADTLNTLLETSGQPITWESTGNPTVVGLAPYGLNGIPQAGWIAAAKLDALTPDEVQSLVGNSYGFYFNVSYIDNTTSPPTYKLLKSLGNYNGNATDIVKVEKVALYSKVVYSIVDQIKGSGIQRSYNTYTVNCFQTNNNSNQSYDYWIMVNNHGFTPGSVSVNINNGTINLQNSSSVKINSTFLYLNPGSPAANTVSVVANGTSNSYMDFYIIQVPKNTSSVSLNDANQAYCRVDLYLWTQ